MNASYAVIIAFFILAGAAIAGWNLRKIVAAKKTANWPNCQAKIRYIEAADQRIDGITLIEYQYEVNNESYKNVILPASGESDMPGYDKYFQKKYPEGSSLSVFYNPDTPSISLQSVGVKREDWLIFYVGISTIFMGIYGFFL